MRIAGWGGPGGGGGGGGGGGEAKGALMLLYGLDSAAAEQLLRRHSRERGVRTAVLADEFLHTVAALG
ncbi:ANTAR domain-containing protein, partial [Nocardia farcinica]|uniref:ANTAR domain-containing protein n=1 Tax=Nocardia farcinica TaxID=37329 RepID=UPI0024551840